MPLCAGENAVKDGWSREAYAKQHAGDVVE